MYAFEFLSSTKGKAGVFRPTDLIFRQISRISKALRQQHVAITFQDRPRCLLHLSQFIYEFFSLSGDI